MRRGRIFATCALAALACVTPAVAGVPIRSTSGSGAFGRWAVDGAGLPIYRYTLDQARAPFARQPELLGRTDAWHQIGNERAIATASNDGQVQLWSQDRLYQWANRYDPDARQLAGGFGWLRSGSTTFSTRYADRPAGRAHPPGVRHGLRAPNAGQRRLPSRRAGLCAARRRTRAGARGDDRQHDAPRALRLVVRVLGRQPVRPGRKGADRLGVSAHARARPGAHRRPARVSAGPAAADDLRGGLGGAGDGPGDQRRAVLRRRRRRPPRRGRRGTGRPGAGARGRARYPRADDARLPERLAAAAGPARDPALRLRHRPC